MRSATAPEWSTDAGRPVDMPVPSLGRHVEVASLSTPTPLRTAKRFTALVDADTDTRYARLLEQLRTELGPIATREDGHGHTRAGYDISRADLLRALLAVADDQPDLRTAVADQLRRHYVAAL